MKILNPRVGMLSNYEVLEHITEMKARYTEAYNTHGASQAMKSENLETVIKEAREYLSTTAAATQSPENINSFLSAISPYALEKAELLMIINQRPSSVAELDCLIEEMDQRFPGDENQEQMLEIVKTHLPPPPKIVQAADLDGEFAESGV